MLSWAMDTTPRRTGSWRIVAAVGTRPEVIKLAPVIRALRAHPAFEVRLCAVAQQAAMLDDTLRDWRLVPDYTIPISGRDRGPAAILGEMLPALAYLIRGEQPDLLLVQGDTTTNLAVGLAGFYEKIPVAHVEAGLRSGDMARPFPEEMHRVVTDRLAWVHYAPTERARQNLLAEGCSSSSIVVVGNTVVDAMYSMLGRSRRTELMPGQRPRTILVTAHRRESFGDGMESICRAVKDIVYSRSYVHVDYILHTNPAARGPAIEILADCPRVRLREPMPYPRFLRLMKESDVILSDSGGVQEEAPYLGRPVVVTRDVTERPEAAELGRSLLVGAHREAIVGTVLRLLDDEITYRAMARPATPFGDGHSAERIRDDLLVRFARRPDFDTVPTVRETPDAVGAARLGEDANGSGNEERLRQPGADLAPERPGRSGGRRGAVVDEPGPRRLRVSRDSRAAAQPSVPGAGLGSGDPQPNRRSSRA
jgi:UDP-N-acetylglucosamine 2-epimerase (non-hydrolysing)